VIGVECYTIAAFPTLKSFLVLSVALENKKYFVLTKDDASDGLGILTKKNL
jgi:hypothetical protein